MITSGKDKFYEKLVERDNQNNTKVICGEPCDISIRVARHVYSILEIINAYNKYYDTVVGLPDEVRELGKIEVSGVPSYDEIVENGLGYYLK